MSIHIGIWDVELVDDGTLDTVLRVTMRVQPNIHEEVRFSQEYAEVHRDPDGGLTDEGFTALAMEAVEHVEDGRAAD